MMNFDDGGEKKRSLIRFVLIGLIDWINGCLFCVCDLQVEDLKKERKKEINI